MREVAGGLRGAMGPEVMAAVIDRQLQQYQHAISLDFKRAFDTVCSHWEGLIGSGLHLACHRAMRAPHSR